MYFYCVLACLQNGKETGFEESSIHADLPKKIARLKKKTRDVHYQTVFIMERRAK